MKTTLVRSFAAPLAGLLVFTALAGAPRQAVAASRIAERPISDFVNAQGTFDLGFLVVPPVPIFFGWQDSVSGLSLSIDYAGLAAKTCKGVADTKFAGTVTERRLPDGRAEVTVKLFTLDAITWVVDGFDWANDPVIFGARWHEDEEGNCVMDGRRALGDSMLKVTFINTRPRAPLPDLIQLVAAPEPGQELRALSIHAVATGRLADGTWVRAETRQVAKLKDGELKFSTETVSLRTLLWKEADEDLGSPLD